MARTGRPRTVWVDEDFFNGNTNQVMYWAGFILADGNVITKCYR